MRPLLKETRFVDLWLIFSESLEAEGFKGICGLDNLVNIDLSALAKF
jgi:hypothetical protein